MIILGSKGNVKFRRNQATYTIPLTPALVDNANRRLLINNSEIITGDRYTYTATPALFPGGTSTTLYVFVDLMGSVSFYDSLSKALTGGVEGAIALPSNYTGTLTLTPAPTVAECLGDMQSFNLRTTRDSVDVTALGDAFKNFDSTLVSGSGSCNCLFSIMACADDGCTPNIYLAELLLRVEQGNGFRGEFYALDEPMDGSAVWYEADCLVTNTALEISGDNVARSTIEFITTGVIELRSRDPVAGFNG